MKKPKISDLIIDSAETKQIRSVMSRRKSVKITINIDAKTLAKFRNLSAKSGVPYQRLINKSLAESLISEASAQSRLEQIEKEVKALKRKLAA